MLFVVISFCLLPFIVAVDDVNAAAAAALKISASQMGQDAWNWNPKWKPWPTKRPPPTPNKARITILDVGRIVSKVNGNGKDFEYVPTIALIEDGKDKIIFDTGLPTDSGSLNRMLKALSNIKIQPTSINKVILSHAHMDHTGHADTFTNAEIYHGNHLFKGFSLTYIGTYEFGGYNVTQNVKIVPTPGHTATCISALINNAETLVSSKPQQLGLVAITGDLFFKEEDLKDDTIWKSSSTDIAKQGESRTAILCDVDYIIPGHGPMFKVPATEKAKCPKPSNCITVNYGDTFFDLCINKLHSTMQSCIAHSNIPNPDLIYPGQQVCA
uniref:Metallo-beta-lactamase domain-containing protein n=1 Tax=Panagrolaimus sp. PS1159 TaxID=55785 RepID=A0AC35GHV2_9BILA